jgi:pimeloyl-ACP methyl ester carboxylesterase
MGKNLFRCALCSLALVCFSAANASAAPQMELGEINGAAFRIDIPDNWNGQLVVYCHGYAGQPVKFKNDAPNAIMRGFLEKGYAMAQSGYSTGGWAVAEAATDTESLRRYFSNKYTAPKKTWVMGHSMGGLITMMLMERYPSVYEGALPLCGVLEGTYRFFHNIFVNQALFNYYFPNLVPGLDDGKMSGDAKELGKKVLAALEAEPAKAEVLRKLTGLKTNALLANGAISGTGALAELRKRAGGNAFDNSFVVYTGTLDDNAANAGVKRYEADPKALAYVRANYATTGQLTRPALAIHTTIDPTVPPESGNGYGLKASEAGNGALFQQQFVQRNGHCSITAAETLKGFDELLAWVNEGKRPTAGDRTQSAQGR